MTATASIEALSPEHQRRWLALEDIKARRQAERRSLSNATERADEVRADCRKFSGFVRHAWPILEPTNPLKWSWHLDAMCDHLEAITFGRLTPRIIFNVPPGSSKSMIVSVLWQAWEWGPCGLASHRFLTSSFELENVKRDTRKTRDLIRSDWFQALWPLPLVRAGELSFANGFTGTREGVAFVAITGKRGDRWIIDDPHSLDGAESETERTSAVRRFLEGGLNRVNDQAKSAIVVVMQRLHEADLAGELLARALGFVHVCLPMEFEPERRCVTQLPFRDPRSYDGELLDPIRFPREVIERDFKPLGYSWAGQYQQRPTAREGGLFKRHWFEGKIIKVAPNDVEWVRHWDLAATKKTTAARTAGVKIGRSTDGKRFYVAHVALAQEEGAEVRRLIKSIAETDGRGVEISLPQDPGQAGKVQAQEYVSMLAGWNVRAEPETGDKTTRAEPFSAQCEAGNVFLIEGDWNGRYLDELCLFPGGSFKDQVDASSGAFGRLVRKPLPSYPLVGSY